MMKKKYLIKPEVAGQLGKHTIIDTTKYPPIVDKLHYEFDDWLGDDILQCFPCFISSEPLSNFLKDQKLTGFTFENCEISKSQLFADLNENGLNLPGFYWLRVIGNEDNDFFLLPNARLIVSEKALNALRQFNINYCDIEEYNG
jgi:hypothetical protein